MSEKELWDLGIQSIHALESERGILASGRDEAYGCIFGRDSLIVSLALLRAHEKSRNPYFISLVRRILKNLGDLQGTEVNIESGEEPGKIIHEYRPERHDHLTAGQGWYLYPDNVMRNFDTVDATPLYLLAIHAYLRTSGDTRFVEEMMGSIQAAIAWLLDYGDTNNDGLIDYWFHPERTYGGLSVQSWMDSAESLFFENSAAVPAYPIAPVEVQAYSWAALCAWGGYFQTRNEILAKKLAARADYLKKRFNETFVLQSLRSTTLAFAIDGNGKKLTAPRSSMGHVLWAAYKNEAGVTKSIIDDSHIPLLVRRLLARDLFVERAGIRTLSNRSLHYDPNSYHNGSIWPHDTAMLADGLENFGYLDEARHVRQAIKRAYVHFKTPIELFVFTKRKFAEYESKSGQRACRTQAWSAASLLAILEVSS